MGKGCRERAAKGCGEVGQNSLEFVILVESVQNC